MVVNDEPRHRVREERHERDERRCAGDPPTAAEDLGEAHHDQQREADEPELSREPEPVAEEPLGVADLRSVVSPRPPELEEAERDLREPEDPEPEHSEQHPGSDLAGGRLARETMPAPCVQ